MGIVYEAEDVRLGRCVALKFLPERLSDEPGALERFQREARATGRLNHPSICTLYDIEEVDGRPFIVMERLEGRSLKERLAATRLPGAEGHGEGIPVAELLEIAVQVADGLEAAHSHGVIHRDIKPANIFLTRRGQVKILDFGLAKLAGQPAESVRGREQTAVARVEAHAKAGAEAQAESAAEAALPAVPPKAAPAGEAPLEDISGLTADGAIAGTVAYMSPEQVRGEELDERSDLFSFGTVLYEMATGEKPFQGTTAVRAMMAVLETKPAPPGIFRPGLPPALETIIAKALEKKRELRYPSAAEMLADLRRLKRELEANHSGVERIGAPARSVFRGASRVPGWVLLGAAGVAAVLVIVLGLFYVKQRRLMATPTRNSVAVLPFRNLSGDAAQDYLQVALADEVANILTYTPGLEVRPVSAGLSYADGKAAPQRIGRELRAAEVVTGHYVRQDENLIVTLEAVEVRRDRSLWRGTVTVPVGDSLAMQKKLEAQVRQGLLPALGGAASGALETATRPRNAEAYDIYLRSAAMSHDPAPNEQAIHMLERAVALDPGYAPAWDALGFRYYYAATYGNAGSSTWERASAAYERAIALDANYLIAMAHLVRIRVARGDLAEAYRQARALIASRPDSAEAHFTLSYVLRYAGRLDESARECDAALAADPGYYGLRSCGIAYAELGNATRALEYLNLDAGSEFTANLLPSVLLRQGDLAAAREAARRMTNDPTWFGGLLQACLRPGAATEMETLDRRVRATEAALEAQRDPEFRYLQAAQLTFCGEREAAVKLLRSAIQANYCAAQALERDPLLAKLRIYPEYQELRAAAAECQRRFRQ
jgi:serine/threonine protein kinase/TolB-like protein